MRVWNWSKHARDFVYWNVFHLAQILLDPAQVQGHLLHFLSALLLLATILHGRRPLVSHPSPVSNSAWKLSFAWFWNQYFLWRRQPVSYTHGECSHFFSQSEVLLHCLLAMHYYKHFACLFRQLQQCIIFKSLKQPLVSIYHLCLSSFDQTCFLFHQLPLTV